MSMITSIRVADSSACEDEPTGETALHCQLEEKVLQISEVCVSKNGPNFLKVYVIPVLLLNLAVGGWGVIATHKAQGMMISLGYAVIVTVSLYLYLLYLGRYLS